MFVLEPLLQARTTILPSQTLVIPPGTSFAGSVKYLSILVSAVLGVGRDPIFPSFIACIDFEQKWIAWFDSIDDRYEQETRLLFAWLTTEHSINKLSVF